MSSEYGKRLTAAIELEYDFTIRGYLPIPEISLTSKKALLQTDKGTFFLKEKPFYCTSPDSLFRSFTFQDYCASYSDKMVAIKKTKNNQHYISFEKSIFFITPFKSGTGFSGKPEDLSKMFDVLVELRKIGRGYLQEYSDKSDYLPENESYDVILPFTFLESKVLTREDQRIFDNLKEALELLKREYGSIERKKYAMSHSDCILFNFQIFDHKAILHDFDNAKVLPSVHDIAEFFVSSCLLNYAGSITNLKLPVFLSCHKKNTKGLIKKIVNELEKDEITLIPICIEIIWLWSLMLGVIKDDYDLNDLAPATENIFERKLSKELYSLFGNSL